MKHIRILLFILLQSPFFLISCSKEKLPSSFTNTLSTPIANSNDNGNVFKNQTWRQNWPPGTGLRCLQWVGNGIFVNHPYASSPRFGVDYYADHVRVYIKPSDAASWMEAPYSPGDHNGISNNQIYFTDDNYVVTLPGMGTVVAPRILIIGKPSAQIDFLKMFDVKIVFV